MHSSCRDVRRDRRVMKLGEPIEFAIWITGDEAPEIRRQYEQDIRDAFKTVCAGKGFEHGPVTFVEKLPGAERVPEVPKHIQGSRVRLLVAEATVVAAVVQTSRGSFCANLEKKDLQRLRAITRRAWQKQHPQALLTDQQCDECIEQLGPAAALETLRANHHTLQ